MDPCCIPNGSTCMGEEEKEWPCTRELNKTVEHYPPAFLPTYNFDLSNICVSSCTQAHKKYQEDSEVSPCINSKIKFNLQDSPGAFFLHQQHHLTPCEHNPSSRRGGTSTRWTTKQENKVQEKVLEELPPTHIDSSSSACLLDSAYHYQSKRLSQFTNMSRVR